MRGQHVREKKCPEGKRERKTDHTRISDRIAEMEWSKSSRQDGRSRAPDLSSYQIAVNKPCIDRCTTFRYFKAPRVHVHEKRYANYRFGRQRRLLVMVCYQKTNLKKAVRQQQWHTKLLAPPSRSRHATGNLTPIAMYTQNQSITFPLLLVPRSQNQNTQPKISS